MKTFFETINSAVGKKLQMSLTGFFLCSFLVVHLMGNLLLFSGPDAFTAYSNFMKTNGVVRVLEIGLALGFLIHIYNGIYLWIMNRSARPKGYAVYRYKDTAEAASRIMYISATITLIYLIGHLMHYTVPARITGLETTLYDLVVTSFQDPLITILYLSAFVLLGYHLKHGFMSALQTLGLKNKKVEGFLKVIAAIFWLLVPLAYASIPIYFFVWGNPSLLSFLGGN